MTRFSQNCGETGAGEVGYGGFAENKPRRRWRKILGFAAGLLLLFAVATGSGAYFYWRSFYDTPQYSLALLVEAALSENDAEIDRLVDTDAVVDDFVPQLTEKAIELYGRGAPPAAIKRMEKIAGPLMPAIKDRARAEIPNLIRRKTEKFADVPFAAMVVGAEKYLDIARNGDTAIVRSKLPRHSFEVKMRRNGTGWQIVGVRDDQLAERIAHAIGQQMIGLASKYKEIGNVNEDSGLGNLQEIIRRAEEIFK